MIREVGESIGRAVLDGIGRAASRVQERKGLPVDLLENDEAFLAVFDAPGATAEDVDVRFEDNRLRVRVDRVRERHEGYEMRFPGRGLTLAGRVTLPEDAEVKAKNADATLRTNGTLEVLVPKSQRSKAERVATDGETEAGPSGEESDGAASAAPTDGEDETVQPVPLDEDGGRPEPLEEVDGGPSSANEVPASPSSPAT